MEKTKSLILNILGYIKETGKAFATEYSEEPSEDWQEFSEKNKDNETVKMINEEMKKLKNAEYRRKQAKKAVNMGVLENVEKQLKNPEKRPNMKMKLIDKDLQK